MSHTKPYTVALIQMAPADTPARSIEKAVDNFLDAFAAAVMAAGEKALAKAARDNSLSYAMDENHDLYDFTRLVVEGSQNADVKAKGQALMNYVTGTLVMHSRARDSQGGWGGPKYYTLGRGMAAYFPGYALAGGYDELAWAKASQWDEFVQWINQ